LRSKTHEAKVRNVANQAIGFERMRFFFCFALLLCSNCLRQSASHPTGAGSCIGGKPAVGESHLAYGDGSRHIRSGDLRDSYLQLFVDGTDLTASASPFLIEAGAYHVVEIVANTRPFKGALIRVESTTTVLSLDPLINAGEESECATSKAQGVSHVDNASKNAFSAGLTVQSEGEVTLDVTVVEYNNATGSVFWYSHFKLKAVEDLDHDSVSSGDPCFVCGSEGTDVTGQSQVVMLTGLALTCPELSSLGRRSGIPSEMCDEATALAKASCGCLPMATPSAAKAPAPTSAGKCYVCGSEGSVVGNPNAEVLFENKASTCSDMYHDGLMVRCFSHCWQILLLTSLSGQDNASKLCEGSGGCKQRMRLRTTACIDIRAYRNSPPNIFGTLLCLRRCHQIHNTRCHGPS
jgi:hypothetical protein